MYICVYIDMLDYVSICSVRSSTCSCGRDPLRQRWFTTDFPEAMGWVDVFGCVCFSPRELMCNLRWFLNVSLM